MFVKNLTFEKRFARSQNMLEEHPLSTEFSDFERILIHGSSLIIDSFFGQDNVLIVDIDTDQWI